MATILIVDDNPDLLRIMHDVLSVEYDVITAQCGEDAVALARQHRPALAILDLQLPGIDGIEAGCSIRDELGNDVRIMMLSATAEYGRQRVIDAGFSDMYIDKPATLDAIRTNVAHLLAESSHAA